MFYKHISSLLLFFKEHLELHKHKEKSVWQIIHMNGQYSFSLKNKKKIRSLSVTNFAWRFITYTMVCAHVRCDNARA